MKQNRAAACVLVLLLSTITASSIGPNTVSAFKAMSLMYRLPSEFWRQRSLDVMNGYKILSALGTARDVRDAVCRETDGICSPGRSHGDFERGHGETANVVEQKEDSLVRSRRSNGCGRGVARDGHCICPIDYFGERCDRPRNFHCYFSRVIPAKCDIEESPMFDPRLDGDAPCISYSRGRDKPLLLGYKLSCTLNTLLNGPEKQAGTVPFKYVLRKDTLDDDNLFALSEIPEDEVLFRPFNWDRPFSDHNFSERVRVTKGMLLGTEAVRFSVPVADMLRASPGYSRGGRLFAEVRLLGKGGSRISTATECWRCVGRAFVEIFP